MNHKSENQKRYDDTHTRQVKFKFNIITDADILEKLDSVPNKQAYIKELIRRNINEVKTMTNLYVYTPDDFTTAEQWEAFRGYVRRSFVNALNEEYKKAVKCFGDNLIEFNELDHKQERKLSELVDLAKEA